MTGKVKFAFSIELGPDENDKNLLVQNVGFRVRVRDIEPIARSFYVGIYEYLRSFLQPHNTMSADAAELRSFCSLEYDRLKNQDFVNE
jgi:hypothetical protein